MRLAPAFDTSMDANPFGAVEMARTLAFLYVTGGLLVLVTVLAPHAEGSNVLGVAATGGVAALIGVVLLRVGNRLPVQAVAGFLALGSVAITTAIYFDGHAASVYCAFYLWVGAESFLFLNWRGIGLQMALIAASYAWVLDVVSGDGVGGQHWLMIMGATIVVGAMVGYLRGRLVRLLRRLTDVALTDELTGIPNRRAFEERFEAELARAAREGRPLSLLVGDLDGFKLVNDRLGHQEGDRVLRRAAVELQRLKRTSDVAARVGGEEFALLLPGTGSDEAMTVAERVRLGLQLLFERDEVPLSVSFGIATFPVHAPDREGVLRAADQALYTAKETGRNRSVVYSSEASVSLEGVRRRLADSSEMQLATIVGLSEALDIRDTGTGEHSRTVARYAGLMARHLGFPEDQVERIELAGLLHDVGKIGISDSVLTKAGPLTDDEWSQMRTHPQIGARLLGRPELADLRSWVIAHHERPDGTGYPFGLAGDEIPLEARILSVADAYEAMTADRVYKKAMAEEAAREELKAGSGRQFDGDVVDVFFEALDAPETDAELVAS